MAYASRRAVSRVVSTCPAVGMTADAARLEARATNTGRVSCPSDFVTDTHNRVAACASPTLTHGANNNGE